MARNLFISYDLNSPGKDYTKVIEAVKSLGQWAKAQKSFWYVSSSYTAEQAANIVWAHMDSSDSLMVVDASGNDAHWFNIPEQVTKHIQAHWRT